VSREANDKLRRAKELLSHAIPSGDMAQVLERALDALIEQCERRQHAATVRPGRRRVSAHGKRIPAEVKREVWRRDGGRCAFVSASGKRCEERRFLEYDHAVPVARGGHSTADNVRLRCRAHNQHEADRVFGKGFMDGKRQTTRVRQGPRPGPMPAGTSCSASGS
jgi:5-methylcytosine-specific restriction endonuclease McrA